MKNVVILRGVPGSGKSTVAKFLLETSVAKTKLDCVTDDYFTDEDGNYNFDPSKIGEAHAWNFERFKKAVDDGVEYIIQSNTNVIYDHFKDYKEYAEANGYRVMIMVIENYHGNSNSHSVPTEVVDRMESTLKQNIKLK